ncbi:MAG: hypothetical protein KF878_16455 [Planctomycetes bacterium]|nr:hypothetical protein [Planctomycetota bacterium]
MSGHRRAFACLALLCAAGVLALPLDQTRESSSRSRLEFDEAGATARELHVDRTTRAYGIVHIRSTLWRAGAPASGPVPGTEEDRAELLRAWPDLADELAREPDGWSIAWRELVIRAPLGLLLFLLGSAWWVLVRRSPLDLRGRPAHAAISSFGLALVPWLPLTLLLAQLWVLAGQPLAGTPQLVGPGATIAGTALLLGFGLVLALRPRAGAEASE